MVLGPENIKHESLEPQVKSSKVLKIDLRRHAATVLRIGPSRLDARYLYVRYCFYSLTAGPFESHGYVRPLGYSV